jgi:hypothetical protein
MLPQVPGAYKPPAMDRSPKVILGLEKRRVPDLYKPPEIDGSPKVILGFEKRMILSKSAESFTTMQGSKRARCRAWLAA